MLKRPASDVESAVAAPPSSPSAVKKKRRSQPMGNLTNLQKRQLCIKFSQVKMTQQELCQWAKREFQLAHLPHQSTISKILARTEELTQMAPRDLSARRKGLVTHPELDTALCNWVLCARHNGLKISGDIIKSQARALAAQLGITSTMTFSNGWLGGFKKRYNIRLGSAASAMDGVSGMAMPSNIHSLEQLQGVARMYDPRDVYCMQETGLFYEMSPEKPSGRGRAARRDNCGERLTVVFAVNADASDRFEPMFIGPRKLPQPAEDLDADSRHIYYQNNKRAWMTPVMFQDYISAIDTRMRDEGRYILLLATAAPSHVCLGLELTNVRLEILPSSMMESLSTAMHVSTPVNADGNNSSSEASGSVAATEVKVTPMPESSSAESVANQENAVKSDMEPNPETMAAFDSIEEDIDKEICDTVAALDILRPLPVDEFVSPRDENSGIHCAGLEDTDFLYTVPDNSGCCGKHNANGVANTLDCRQHPVMPTELTPRLQELHARIEASASSSASALGLAPTMNSVVTGEVMASLPTSSASMEDMLGLSTLSPSVKKAVDGPATNEQLIECFKMLLPELDRLRFDDHTKKSIRITFRKLKETAEQQALDRKRGTTKKAHPRQQTQVHVQPSPQGQQAQALQIQQLQQQQIHQMQQQLMMHPDQTISMTAQTSQISEDTVL
ncbi:hypothetical protein PsorP6_007603 [Peronosclerospora sorghi]|uniref:Uncharacterized protein n=1 Tax=Peronosclerospora sorghi TaxID=230839 RepID=A0ACC0WA51_9STRA|nr:hypothetical protein PsorP6_007603 [Peronosclerospora sorghi]